MGRVRTGAKGEEEEAAVQHMPRMAQQWRTEALDTGGDAARPRRRWRRFGSPTLTALLYFHRAEPSWPQPSRAAGRPTTRRWAEPSRTGPLQAANGRPSRAAKPIPSSLLCNFTYKALETLFIYGF